MPNFELAFAGGTLPEPTPWVDDFAGGSRLNTPRHQPVVHRISAASLPGVYEVQAKIAGDVPVDVAVNSRFEWTWHQRGLGGPPVLDLYDAARSGRCRFTLRSNQVGLWLLVCRRVARRLVFTADDTTDLLTFTAEPPADGTEIELHRGTTAVLPTTTTTPLALETSYWTRDKTGSGPWTCKLARTLGGPAVDLTSDGSGILSLSTSRDDSMGSGFLVMGFCVEA